jgi:hypothetical protein
MIGLAGVDCNDVRTYTIEHAYYADGNWDSDSSIGLNEWGEQAWAE